MCCPERTAPIYAAATVVHSATGLPALAPNTFGTIYGKDLAVTTRALAGSDLEGGLLPVVLLGTGVRVTVEGLAAPIWYVSPTQINFLIPGEIPQKPLVKVYASVNGRAGPEVEVRLLPAAPGLFRLDPETVLAVRLDKSVVKLETPVAAGQDVILFATGLGPTMPDVPYRYVAGGAAPIVRRAEFRLLLNGSVVPDQRIRYVGAAPGFAGLYQINLWLPEDSPSHPEIQVAVGEALSPPGLRLPVR